MSETGYTSVSHEGFSVETNTGDEAAIRLSMGAEASANETSESVDDGADGSDRQRPGTGGAKPAAGAAPDGDLDGSPVPPKQDATDATDRNPDGTFKAKPKKGSLDRLIWEREEAERKAKAADERAARLEAELTVARQPRREPERQPEPAREAAKPEAAKFAFPKYEDWAQKNPDAAYEDYVEEKTYARITHERQREERERTDRAQYDEHHTLVLAHRTREIQARTQYPEYDALVSTGTQAMAAAGFAQLPAALGKAILISDRSTDIIRDLAAHPADAIQLAREVSDLPMTAAPMVRRLLEARLVAAPSGPAASPKPVSAAKPLIKPVSGTPIASDPDDGSDDEPIEAHIRRENARDRKAGRR